MKSGTFSLCFTSAAVWELKSFITSCLRIRYASDFTLDFFHVGSNNPATVTNVAQQALGSLTILLGQTASKSYGQENPGCAPAYGNFFF